MTNYNPQQSTKSASSMSSRTAIWFLLGFAVATLDSTPTANSFAVVPTSPVRRAPALYSSYDLEDEVARRLAKAKEVLARSKEKLEQKEAAATNGANVANGANGANGDAPNGSVPFFAAKEAPAKDPNRRDKIVKNKDEKTGLVTADGEKMAEMSENEDWERRSLFEVFENNLEENEDVYSEATQALRERDVAASIWNLRKRMQQQDYMKIFDKRNFFIGEDN